MQRVKSKTKIDNKNEPDRDRKMRRKEKGCDSELGNVRNSTVIICIEHIQTNKANALSMH